MPDLSNLKRHLDKAEQALDWTERHLTLTNEANAALHLSEKVFYSPLTSLVHDALEGCRLALREFDPEDAGDAPATTRLHKHDGYDYLHPESRTHAFADGESHP